MCPLARDVRAISDHRSLSKILMSCSIRPSRDLEGIIWLSSCDSLETKAHRGPGQRHLQAGTNYFPPAPGAHTPSAEHKETSEEKEQEAASEAWDAAPVC